MRKGAPWLKTTLIQCCWTATRKKGSYIQAQFHRIRSRRGAKKANGAVAASILTAIYHMLKNGTCYQELGHDHFDHRTKSIRTKRLVARPACRIGSLDLYRLLSVASDSIVSSAIPSYSAVLPLTPTPSTEGPHSL